MAKRINPALGNKTWQPGIHEAAAFALEIDEKYIVVKIDYNTFTHKVGEQPTNLRINVLTSYDGGLTYPRAHGMTDISIEEGEIRLDEDGDVLFFNILAFNLKEIDNPNRRMKLELEIDRAVKTGIDVEIDSVPIPF